MQKVIAVLTLTKQTGMLIVEHMEDRHVGKMLLLLLLHQMN